MQLERKHRTFLCGVFLFLFYYAPLKIFFKD
nr:MAG TPA: hypothetical protein [Caudoviricetes sp.]